MAVDTRSKRASVLGLGLAAALTLPLADAAVGQSDRQHVAFAYPGISAGSPIPPIDPTPDWIVRCASDDIVVRIPPDAGVTL
jgi:hypothetical protein